VLARFAAFCGGQFPGLEAPDRASVEAWISSARERGVKPATLHGLAAPVRELARWSVTSSRPSRQGHARPAVNHLTVEQTRDRTRAWARAMVGIGSVSTDWSGLPKSRESADRALRVLRANRDGKQVASIADVAVEAWLIELRDLITKRGDPLTGPLARLLEYDKKHRACLVETFRAWLDAFGDVIAAAQAVNVHPNTFRYRLRRVTEVGEIDLADADTRFAMMLQLRLMTDGASARRPRAG
jgi:sugar diacid utilization regulator